MRITGKLLDYTVCNDVCERNRTRKEFYTLGFAGNMEAPSLSFGAFPFSCYTSSS